MNMLLPQIPTSSVEGWHTHQRALKTDENKSSTSGPSRTTHGTCIREAKSVPLSYFNNTYRGAPNRQQAVEVFDMIVDYEYESVKDKNQDKAGGGFWGRVGSDEQAELDEALVTPTAKEYGSMLHILSKSKDSKRGSNWERSMELLREAQENEFPISELSFQTGVCRR